ncbi:MAG: phosphotransferase [Arcanobacterium sp.]|nr:phosphotransferase [Arcanobacterium sp.]MDY5588604.1 phosphotransferase [Arcanobacterium sp.]
MKLSPLHLAALAVVAVPELNAAGTRPPYLTTEDFIVGGVLDSEGRHWIVKYPRTDQGGTFLEAETAVAGALIGELREGRLSFDVMHPEGYATYEGRRAVVYPAPLGKPLPLDRLDLVHAREVGRTVAAIHSIQPQVLTRAGLPTYTAHAVRERLASELDDATTAAHVPALLCRRWLNMFDDDALWNFETTVVHGDMADENLLWSEATIRTVLGFGEAHVGDPAADLAPLSAALSDAAFDALFSAYSQALAHNADEHLLERTTLMSEFALVRWLLHGVLAGDSHVIDDATTMLEQLAIEIDANPETSPGPSWHLDTPLPVETPLPAAGSTEPFSQELAQSDAHDPADTHSTISPLQLSHGAAAPQVPTALTADLAADDTTDDAPTTAK